MGHFLKRAYQAGVKKGLKDFGLAPAPKPEVDYVPPNASPGYVPPNAAWGMAPAAGYGAKQEPIQ